MTVSVTFTYLAAPAHAAAAPPPPGWAVAFAIALFVIAVTVPLIVLRTLGDRRAAHVLEAWTRANGLTLEEKRLIPFQRGPFAMRGRWTSVFRIRARSATGEVRSAWVCTNNVFLWGASPEVRWDET